MLVHPGVLLYASYTGASSCRSLLLVIILVVRSWVGSKELFVHSLVSNLPLSDSGCLEELFLEELNLV